MNQALFKDFDPSTKEEWYQQALKDLKGKDFDQTLLWPTDEGFVVAPYYTEQDLPPIHQYIQEICQEKLPGWLNLIAITYTDEKTTNQAIKSNLSVGGDAFVIDFENKKTEEINWSKLLDGIKLSDVPIYFKIKCQGKSLSEVLRKIIPYQMKGGISDDILAQLMQTGVFPKNAFEDLAALISYTQNSPQFRSLSVDTTIFHNAGASATQELAFGLASGVTYLDKLTDLGL
ncbi:MAG: methylmalonyl-CoA mutase family protein, partial [Runella sp.]